MDEQEEETVSLFDFESFVKLISVLYLLPFPSFLLLDRIYKYGWSYFDAFDEYEGVVAALERRGRGQGETASEARERVHQGPLDIFNRLKC